ncbi:MAG: winged helix-turn-helix domain-containing protein [Armatimonadota bacterium]
MHRVLIVSGDIRSASRLRTGVESAGHHVTIAFASQKDVARALEERLPDLILVDATTIDEELSELQRWLKPRSRSKEIASVVLLDESGLSAWDTASGWSDFVLLPIRPAELRARMRRALGALDKDKSSDVIRVDGLEIDVRNYTVTVGGEPVELTYKEYQLLRFLASHPGRVFTRDELLNEVWGYDYYGGTRTVDVHIRRIRSKLGSPYDSLIQTVHNVGYRFR